MGMALWLACAAVVFFAARRVPYARPASWLIELAATIFSAIVLGAAATALDFAGWKEPDWRGGLFVLLGSAAIVGFVRLGRLAFGTGVGSRVSGVGAVNQSLAPTSDKRLRAANSSPAPTPDPRLPTPASNK